MEDHESHIQHNQKVQLIAMKSPLVLCVLLGVILSVRAASLPQEAATVSTTATTLTEFPDYTTFTTGTTTPYIQTSPSPTDTSSPVTSTPVTSPPGTSTPGPSPTGTSPPGTSPPGTSPPGTSPPGTSPPGTSPPGTSPPGTSPSTTTPNPPSRSQIMCPNGWEVFQGRCYYFVNDDLSWPQAQSSCAMLGSMLASVHSPQEYGFLQQLTYNNEFENAWLGGFYLQDQWLWLDGSWFYNSSWSFESPDSSNPCLTLDFLTAWSNSPCNTVGYPSICVKNSNVPAEMLCPQGWTGFQGRCYAYTSEYLTWHGADASCAGQGASLVSVHTPEEYSFLYQLTTTSSQSSGPTWLGGFYLADQWTWLDGSWFYQGFFNQMSPESSSQCLGTFDADAWTNYACNIELQSFCVKNEVL